MARAMLLDGNLNKSLWSEAVTYSAYILNRLPSQAIDNKIPINLLNKPVDHNKIKVFGSQAHSLIKKNFRNRFDPKTKKIIFVGISNIEFKLLDLSTNKIFIRSDVTFLESQNTNNSVTIPVEHKTRKKKWKK